MKVKPSGYVLLAILIFSALFVRSINFTSHLNFSKDQALFSLKALEIKNGEYLSYGPLISLAQSEEKAVYQGAGVYYLQFIFLNLGNFDPIKASFIFMIFSTLMGIPLFLGLRLLLNKKIAFLISSIYLLFPYYVDYSRFLWNPNFQLSLVPLLVLCLGLFEKYQRWWWFILTYIIAGFLFTLHFQFILVIIGIIVYHWVFKRVDIKLGLLGVVGLFIGAAQLIIFDINNNFSNLKNISFIFESTGNANLMAHYFLSLSLFILLLIAAIAKKYISEKIVITFLVVLLSVSIFIYSKKPSSGFGMVSNWSYIDEQKVNQIIKNQSLESFNITTPSYDSLSLVQKYLLRKDGFDADLDRYDNKKYLYLITSHPKLNDLNIYEINIFKPFKINRVWWINPTYKLYLIERLNY